MDGSLIFDAIERLKQIADLTIEQKFLGKFVNIWTIWIYKDLPLPVLSPSAHIES